MLSIKQQKNMKFEDVNLLIFDLDGTLFDSVRVNYEAIKAGMAYLGWENSITEEDVWNIMGESNEDAFKKLLSPEMFLEKEKLLERVRGYYLPMIEKFGREFPKVLETLQTLKNRGYKLALYSYASPGYFDAAIAKLGIADLFDFAECVEKNGLTKAEMIVKIKNNFGGLEAAVIGDSNHDVDAAKTNSLVAIGVGYGYGGKVIAGADKMIYSPADLLNIFDRRYPIFDKIAAEIRSRKNNGRALVVGVNGIDASGKTEFAKGFESFLKANDFKVQVINLDDFHNPKAIRYSGDDQADNYYRKSFDIEKIVNELLAPLRAEGRLAAEFDVLNLHTDQYDIKRKYDFDADTVVIFEGVFIFRRELVPYLDYKIFIDIPLQESKHRAEIRDVPVYGREVLQKYDEKYLPAQKRYINEFSPHEIAEMVIDNINWEHPKIIKG